MIKILPILIFFLGCIQSYNSNSFDEELYGPESKTTTHEDPEITRTSKAITIIQKNCISCHSGRHNKWTNFSTDSQWIQAKVIIPGNSANSRLIRKLKNRGGNMPFGNPAISEEEVDVLVDWIDQLETN